MTGAHDALNLHQRASENLAMSAAASPVAVSAAHAMFAVMAIAGVTALAAGARIEHDSFARAGLRRAWWLMRLGQPALFLSAGVLVFALAEHMLGSDGRILAYLGVFLVALPLWFVSHVLAGRLLRPTLRTGQCLWLAASPLAASLALSLVGHRLQPWVWELAAWFAGGS